MRKPVQWISGQLLRFYCGLCVRCGVGCMLMLLAGCSEPNPLVTSMDNFFDSLGDQHMGTSSGIIVGPGYAPAYPPYDSGSGRVTTLK